MSHTPGPWDYRAQFNNLKDEIGINGRSICTVWVRRVPQLRPDGAMPHQWDAWPEGEANARLIAATPEMLAMLTDLLATADEDIAGLKLLGITDPERYEQTERLRALVLRVGSAS
jgi:hypothetical protein